MTHLFPKSSRETWQRRGCRHAPNPDDEAVAEGVQTPPASREKVEQMSSRVCLFLSWRKHERVEEFPPNMSVVRHEAQSSRTPAPVYTTSHPAALGASTRADSSLTTNLEDFTHLRSNVSFNCVCSPLQRLTALKTEAGAMKVSLSNSFTQTEKAAWSIFMCTLRDC